MNSNVQPVPIVWARHEPATKYCAVETITPSRCVTACKGSWPVEDFVESHDDPPRAERCACCVDRLRMPVSISDLVCSGRITPAQGADLLELRRELREARRRENRRAFWRGFWQGYASAPVRAWRWLARKVR